MLEALVVSGLCLEAVEPLTGIRHPVEDQDRAVEPMRGRSLSGVLSGAASETYTANDFIGGEMRNGKWIRQGPYKAVAVAPPYRTGEWRLFNVEKDPGETRDLAGEQPERLEELMEAWKRYAKDVGVVSSK